MKMVLVAVATALGLLALCVAFWAMVLMFGVPGVLAVLSVLVLWILLVGSLFFEEPVDRPFLIGSALGASFAFGVILLSLLAP